MTAAVMEKTTGIDRAIAELTHVTGTHAGQPVWVYGEMLWADPTAFNFIVIRNKAAKQVTIITSSVKRFRDAETSFFLIEMSSMMAHILEVEDFVLDTDELVRKQRHIDTSRAW
jgi:hypothetical protein